MRLLIIPMLVMPLETISPKAFRLSTVTYEERLWHHIDTTARYYGFDTHLIYRIIEEESAWDIKAISPKQALGLMQLLLPTAREIMEDEKITRERLLNDPFLNAHAGIKYLSWLREQFDGNMKLAVAAYNRGIGRVKNDLKLKRNPLNRYTKRVLRLSS